jgi:membrane-associated phospholipid phosphatase
VRVLFRVVIPFVLFLLIGILRVYTDWGSLLDRVDITTDIPFVWDLFYILIYGTIMFGPLLYWWGQKKEGILLAALLSGAGIAGLLSKPLFGLPRPLHSGEPSYGYPSFHAQISVIGWGYFTKYSRLFVIIPVLTGISRMGRGDHYATDVLGGWLLGIASLYCAPYVARVRVPESVWKRWVIILVAAAAVYVVGWEVEHVPLVLGMSAGFFLGCSVMKKSWKPVSVKRGVAASGIGIIGGIVLLLSVLVLPEIFSTVIAGLWMALCPILFVRVGLLCYNKANK